jgi:hypothetical protein
VDTQKTTILLPTRNRIDACIKSVRTLMDTAAYPENVEVCFAFDKDDVQTMYDVKAVLPESNYRYLLYPRYGYKNLHLYVNSLSAHATGDWLWLWNDDTYCETPGWDLILSHYDHTKPICVSPKTRNMDWKCLFPIISKSWYNVVGRFSNNSHNDTWVEHVAEQCGIFHFEPRIILFHDREDVTGNNNDITRKDVLKDISEEGDWYYRQSDERRIDCEKIQTFLNGTIHSNTNH